MAPGAWAAAASVPGLIIYNGYLGFPVANLALEGRYGIDQDLELKMGLLPLLLGKGVLGLEVGATRHVFLAQGWRPALHATVELNILSKPSHYGQGFAESFRAATALTLTAHWEPVEWLWPYMVTQNSVVLVGGQLLTSLFAGAQWWSSHNVSFSFETGWAAWNTTTKNYTQPYLGIAGHGGVWIGGALSYYFDSAQSEP